MNQKNKKFWAFLVSGASDCHRIRDQEPGGAGLKGKEPFVMLEGSI